MATSGTTEFSLDLAGIADEAWDRASGGNSELRSGYQMRSVRRSLNLLLSDLANRGLNMWTMDSGTIPLEQGVATYSLPTDTVDTMEVVIRLNAGDVSTQSDLYISRISVSTYASLNAKLLQARPNQYLITRGAASTITLWPVPDLDDTYTLVYWRLRRVQDAGNGNNTFDIPFRMLPAITAGLAYYLSLKIPEGAPRVQMLEAAYEKAWALAEGEDREKAAVLLTPKVY